ncbi:MAG TPA: ATP-binding protein, partial [Anaerolineales bacterium]|nr:ATP-binding protein [Anaerolineales bacterium]
MPRKPSRRLHERLDDLFSGLPAPEPEHQGPASPARPLIAVPGGWLWESDLEGRYTWCSPEFGTFLGVSPSKVLSQAVADVGLVRESATELRGLMAASAPIENVLLIYRAVDGSRVRVLLSADVRPGLDGRPAGLRGAVQVLEISPSSNGGESAAIAEAPPVELAPEPAADVSQTLEETETPAQVETPPFEIEEPPTELAASWGEITAPAELSPPAAEVTAPAAEETAPWLEPKAAEPEPPVAAQPSEAEVEPSVEEELPTEDEVITPWEAHSMPAMPASVKREPVVEAPPPPEPKRTPTGSLDRPSRPIRRRQTGSLPKPTPPADSTATTARPGTGELALDRPSRPVRKRQTGRLSPELQAEAEQARLAVTVPPPAGAVSPFEPAPRVATWGPSTAYVDSDEAIQPLMLESAEAITEPRIEGGRLLVPIRVQDEILGVLAFEGSRAGGAWSNYDIEMALAVSQQLAVTLQDARSAQLTQQALDEMREADRLKTQFLANMSHELRTPLNSIIGFSRVILKGIDGPINETQEQDLKAIHGAGLHLLGLINDILDVSKIEAGKMELTFGEVDLGEIVHGVMSTAIALVKDKPIELRTDMQEGLPPVQADSIRVRQVLLNLVSNAAKFTDQGYIEVSAHLIDEAGQREVLVAVEDTGSGISPSDQEKLFEPFSQVDASPTRKTGGTGLGLSICRHLIELHGGTIWVESSPGEGSVFYFTLPVEQALPEAEGAEAPLVLAIDDNASVLARYRSSFESMGYRFQALPQADGAVDLAAQLQPAILVVDPQLPSQAAWGLIQGLRTSTSTRTTPILLGSFAPDSGRAFRLHSGDILPAPVAAGDLIVALKRVLPADKPTPVVLLVDDKSEAMEELQGDLAENGQFSVRTASSSSELYEKARHEPPDVIVLHALMARAEGFRALEIVRKDAALQSIPLILLARSQPHPEERRQLALYVEYLQRQGTATEADYLSDLKRTVQA